MDARVQTETSGPISGAGEKSPWRRLTPGPGACGNDTIFSGILTFPSALEGCVSIPGTRCTAPNTTPGFTGRQVVSMVCIITIIYWLREPECLNYTSSGFEFSFALFCLTRVLSKCRIWSILLSILFTWKI